MTGVLDYLWLLARTQLAPLAAVTYLWWTFLHPASAHRYAS